MAPGLSPRGATAQTLGGGSRREWPGDQTGWSAASTEGHFC